MLRKFEMLVMLMVLGLWVVGIAQEDGSAPYPSSGEIGEIGEPLPQFVWRCCCSEEWQNTEWKVVFEGILNLRTWRCAPPIGNWIEAFYVRIEEAEFCCYRGWKVFGKCVSKDATPTCWKRSNITYHFIGCI